MKKIGAEKNQGTSINDKYLSALEKANDWITISEWAQKVSEGFPELLQKAAKQAAAQKNETTGLREIAARLSSQISRGAFGNTVEIDLSERPKRVRWLSEEAAKEHEELEIEEDLEPLKRSQKIKKQSDAFTIKEKYRFGEFDGIIRQLNALFATDFELDHAQAILNKADPGNHHPDNFQILTRSHNRKKSGTNWSRLTIDEQIAYIFSVIGTQKIVARKMKLDIQDEILTLIVDRIKRVY